MIEAVIVCDGLCLSKNSLIERMQEVKEIYPKLDYRFASEEECVQLMAHYQTHFTPFMVIDEETLFGVPSKNKIIDLLPPL